jgi:hypothetical protein
VGPIRGGRGQDTDVCRLRLNSTLTSCAWRDAWADEF